MTRDLTEPQLAAIKGVLNVGTAAANRMADATAEIDWPFSRRCKEFVADIGRAYAKLPDSQAEAERYDATLLEAGVSDPLLPSRGDTP